MAMTLVDFPTELLARLFSYLSGADLASISQVCTIFRDSVQIELIWRHRCYHEFGIDKIDTSLLSYEDAYKLLLYKWGYLLGFWKLKLQHYGGLLHVKLVDNRIEATQYHAPTNPQYNSPQNPSVEGPLRQKLLFSLELDSAERKVICRCHRGYRNVQHPAQIIKFSGSGEEKFVYKCCNNKMHSHPTGRPSEFSQWFQEETGTDNVQLDQVDGHNLLLMKYMILLQYDAKMECIRLEWPKPLENVPIQPGLFKGTYSVHGLELIMLDYDLEKNEAHGLKITGDPNVPAGQLTIRADLGRPMILNHDQQSSIMNLSDTDMPDLPPEMTLGRLPVQPFILPRDCYDRHPSAPKQCKYRFHSQGQIAGHGFSSPKFIPGHWIVFDENTFGHIWMELRSLSVYCRVQENFNT